MQVGLIELVLKYVALIHTDNDHEQHQVTDKLSRYIKIIPLCLEVVGGYWDRIDAKALATSIATNVQWYVMFIISSVAAALVIVGGRPFG